MILTYCQCLGMIPISFSLLALKGQNPEKNQWDKIKKSSKYGKGQKTLISISP